MTDHPKLPQTLRKELLGPLEDDIRTHSGADEEIYAHLRAEHQRAKEANRTAHEFGAWRDEQVTLSAVQWILACVFIRFCEDTGLIAETRLAGEGDRLRFAKDATTHYFQASTHHIPIASTCSGSLNRPARSQVSQPSLTPTTIPSTSFRSQSTAPIRSSSYWRTPDPETGDLALSFTDPDRDTRFLGDLYQDLSEARAERYALLQTPEFIESFILDRTLEPAIDEFGLADTDLIDPACGSGHFLLGAFERLLAHWREQRARDLNQARFAKGRSTQIARR